MSLVLDGLKKERTISIMTLLSGMLSFTKLEMGITYTDIGSLMTLKPLSIMIMTENTALVSSTLALFQSLINLEAVLTLLLVGTILN